MEKEKAIKEAEAFREDWELDRWEGLAYNKPTGLMISLGSVWRDKDGHRQFQVIHWYKDEVPGAQRTAAEVNRLLKEFGILYKAGYMPPLTKEERAIKSKKIHEEGEKSRAEFQAEVARQQEWIRTHPKEYEEKVKQNIRKYYAKQQEEEREWYKRSGWDYPEEEQKKYYEGEIQKSIEKFYHQQKNKKNNER